MDPSMLRFEQDVVTYLANLDYNLKKVQKASQSQNKGWTSAVTRWYCISINFLCSDSHITPLTIGNFIRFHFPLNIIDSADNCKETGQIS